MKSAIVTGATSGIGHALAIELARRGYAVGITARRETKLAELASALREEFGAHVAYRPHDVTRSETTHAVLADLAKELGGVSLVVANAGISGGGMAGRGRFSQDRSIIETNLIGGMATVDAAVELMRGRGGHIAGITSVAGFRGLPGSGAYSASKAGFTAYLEAVRCEVAKHGIAVSDIAPGYIDTDIGEDMHKRPFVIAAEPAAAKILDLIEGGAIHRTVPTWPWSVVGFAMRNLPNRVWLRFAKK